MKRPFVTIGISSLMTAVILCYASISTVSVTIFAALAVFLLSVCLISVKSKYAYVIFISFGIAVTSISVLLSMKNYAVLSVYNENECDFSGTVTSADYNETYEKLVIKVDSIDGKKENFYVAVYNNDATGFTEGDEITANVTLKLINNDKKDIKILLADNLFYTADQIGEFSKIGGNRYYKVIGNIKSSYKEVVSEAFPNELGAVVMGMTLGDKTGISTYMSNCFNYSGTAHLLVVSGLHLTIWVMLMSYFIPILRKNRILDLIASAFLIFLYLVLTNFSVSVIRAGIMLFIIKLARLINKSSDNLNSMGIAVFVILVFNPYAVFSVSFLLSVGSTLGLVAFTDRIHNAVYRSKAGKILTRRFAGRVAVDSLIVSVAVSVFTLPVFVFYFDMFPLFSFISNIFIVDLATVLMIFTVSGIVFYKINLRFFSKIFLYVAGIAAKGITYSAEKIGMWQYSTIAVSSRYFRAFLVISVILIFLFFSLNKFKKVRKSALSVSLSILFLLAIFASEYFEYKHPSVDVYMNSKTSEILVRDGQDNVFIGAENDQASYIAGKMLNRHNLKKIGCMYIIESADANSVVINNIKNNYPVDSLAFMNDGFYAQGYCETKEHISSITLDNSVTVIPISDKTVVIKSYGEEIFVSCDISGENLFENDDKYDIIILSARAFEIYGEQAKMYLKDESSEIIGLADTQITIYPDIRKIYYSESF